MTRNRREFLHCTTAMAAISGLPAGAVTAAQGADAYPYLGRTEDYTDFRIIEPGLTIAQVESWTQTPVAQRSSITQSP